MRKQLTPEQIQKSKERHEKFAALWRQIAAMSELERVKLANNLGVVTCEGHPLSLRNTCLLALQCPTVSIVGGFKQWLKQGRCVQKGQHGHMIWIPKKPGKDNGEPIPATDAPAVNDIMSETMTAPANGTARKRDHRFIIGTVFDIAQTAEIYKDNSAPRAEVQVDGVTVMEVQTEPQLALA